MIDPEILIDPDNFSPDLNDGTRMLVFGSNVQGIHGAGAAKEAEKHWGARRGVGKRFTGQAYAIPTRTFGKNGIQSLPLETIAFHVRDFLSDARERPQTTFLVTKIGCGFAGYSEDQIKPMFKDAPANCVLPKGWRI